jgi:hypothetical protein
VSLKFKVNNVRSGLIDYASAKGNTLIGYQGLLSVTGGGNSAFGYRSDRYTTTGKNNTSVGAYALYNNTSGSSNVAIGIGALYQNKTRTNNVAIGDSALYHNETYALFDYHAVENTAIGSKALYSNTRGSYNTANGYNSLRSNTTGSSNTANGYYSLYLNTTGSYNTANGLYSLSSNTTGNYNTANGNLSLYNNTTGSSNTANGFLSLYSNTTGSGNTANGDSSLYSNTTGYSNTANGSYSLYFNTTGYNNTANGYYSLHSNTTGLANTANGHYSLRSNTTGYNNVANGVYSLRNNTTGSSNTANGHSSLYSNTTGSYNTAIGFFADDFSGNLTNATAIGKSAVVDASNKVRIGSTSVTSIGGQVSWTTFSDGRYKQNIKPDVKGLSFINSLRPVTFTVDIDKLDDYFHQNRKNDSAYEQLKKETQASAAEAAQVIYNGFIAQEVEAAAKKLNYAFSGVDIPKNKEGLYGLRYSDFVVPLVKAVQELSSQNDELRTENERQLKINADLENRLARLESWISGNQTSINKTTVSPTDYTLEQNIPNPFSQMTTISYSLPNQYTVAQLVITDPSGKTIKAINISGSGRGSVQVNASTLASGTYSYSLFIDGKIMETKKMILTK